ncbi:hypothetical protein HPP92_003250 [Vanilla planifolia]|nr:hypothetical protein HPP92_003250 [Vanilla planifolia]
MGGLVTLLVYFRSDPDLWTGFILSAPLIDIPDDMKPSKLRLFFYGLLFGLADTWEAMPERNMVGKAIKDPDLLRVIASNPRRYRGRPRVGTMRELARVTELVQKRFGEVKAPFLTVHGTDDGLATPEGRRCCTRERQARTKSSSSTKGCTTRSSRASRRRTAPACSLTCANGSMSVSGGSAARINAIIGAEGQNVNIELLSNWVKND